MQHPLFPDHEDDERELGFIRVWRYERDASRNCSPMNFGGDELDVEQLFGTFGGGRYEVVAHEVNGRIIARARYQFEGPSKPLDGSGTAPAVVQSTSGAPAAQADPSAMGGPWTMMLGVMQMFVGMMNTQAQAQSNLLVALMGKSDSNANQHVQQMTQLHQSFSQTQSALLRAALEQRAQANGGDPTQAFMKGLELARELKGEGQEKDGLDSLVETAMELFAGMQMGRQQQEQPSTPPPAPEGGES